MIQYKAVTPSVHLKDREGNPVDAFKGKTCGIRFEEGVATFNDAHGGLKRVGLTAEQAAIAMVRDFHYEVFTIGDNGELTLFHPPSAKPKTAAKAKAKSAPKSAQAKVPAGS